jgi:hypothetical protein
LRWLVYAVHGNMEITNLDAANVLGVTEDSDSCTVYDNLEEKILEIRPKDSYRFGIS